MGLARRELSMACHKIFGRGVLVCSQRASSEAGSLARPALDALQLRLLSTGSGRSSLWELLASWCLVPSAASFLCTVRVW